MTIIENLLQQNIPIGRNGPFHCVRPILPTATTAKFICEKNCHAENPKLQFEELIDDPERPYPESGYISSGGGDSGAPYWIPTGKDSMGDDPRATLIGVHRGIVLGGKIGPIKNVYVKSEQSYCRQYATKITKPILQWIKQEARIR